MINSSERLPQVGQIVIIVAGRCAGEDLASTGIAAFTGVEVGKHVWLVYRLGQILETLLFQVRAAVGSSRALRHLIDSAIATTETAFSPLDARLLGDWLALGH